MKKMDNKLTKNGKKNGRPTIMTEGLVQKLMDAFKSGHDRDSACAYAGMGRRTFYDHLAKNEVFRTQIEDAENYWMAIVNNQKAKLVNGGYRPAIEKELKSKRANIYGDKSEVTQRNVVDLTDTQKQEILERLANRG